MFSCNKTAARDWRWLSFTRTVLEIILLYTANPKRMNSYTVAKSRLLVKILSLYILELTWNPQRPPATSVHDWAPNERQCDQACDQTVAVDRIDDHHPEKQPDGNNKKYSIENGDLLLLARHCMTMVWPYLLRAVVKDINTYLHDDFNRPEADSTQGPNCWVCCKTPIRNGVLSGYYYRDFNKTYSAKLLTEGRVNECIWTTSKMTRTIV